MTKAYSDMICPHNSQKDGIKITPLLRNIHLHPKTVKECVKIQVESECDWKTSFWIFAVYVWEIPNAFCL